MTNYNYRDLVEELLNGQEVLNNHPEYAKDPEYEQKLSWEEKTTIKRTMQAVRFYFFNKRDFNKDQVRGIDSLVQGFFAPCFEKNAEQIQDNS
jgi:hypothetical protein